MSPTSPFSTKLKQISSSPPWKRRQNLFFLKQKRMKLRCSPEDIFTIFKQTCQLSQILSCAANNNWRLSNITNILFLDAVKPVLPNQIFLIIQKYLGCKDTETNPSHPKYIPPEYIWDAVEEISKEKRAHVCLDFECISIEIVLLQ